MVVFDASVLSLAIYKNAGIPSDFRTGKPIEKASERVRALIHQLPKDGETIIIPAPALAEALAPVADRINDYVNELEGQSVFKIVPFDKREAIELAIRSFKLRAQGIEKTEGIDAHWQKVKYDRQIVAIAKAENAATVYSTDRHIHQHCGLWKMRVLNVSDLPLGIGHAQQEKMFNDTQELPKSTEEGTKSQSAELRGSSEGQTENKAGVESEPAERKFNPAETKITKEDRGVRVAIDGIAKQEIALNNEGNDTKISADNESTEGQRPMAVAENPKDNQPRDVTEK
jgi:hypothetical protein